MEANVKEYNNLFKKKAAQVGAFLERRNSRSPGAPKPSVVSRLVSKIISDGKAGIDSSLRKGSGHRKLGKGIVVKEQGVQGLAQGVICRKFNGEQILP